MIIMIMIHRIRVSVSVGARNELHYFNLTSIAKPKVDIGKYISIGRANRTLNLWLDGV